MHVDIAVLVHAPCALPVCITQIIELADVRPREQISDDLPSQEVPGHEGCELLIVRDLRDYDRSTAAQPHLGSNEASIHTQHMPFKTALRGEVLDEGRIERHQ